MQIPWRWDSFFDNLTSTFLLGGVWVTVWLSVLSMIIGLALGLVSALLALSGNPVLRRLSGAYTTLWRGTPMLVQLIIIYTGLPQLGIQLTVVQSALIGLGVNEGAYVSEIIRAGIQAVPKGQSDAARALGMSYSRRMRLVTLPQAIRLVIPPLGNNFNSLLKSSSLVSVISMEELLRRSQLQIQAEFAVLEIFTVAALYYLALTSAWSAVQRRIEDRLNRHRAPTGPSVRAPEDGQTGTTARLPLTEQDAR